MHASRTKTAPTSRFTMLELIVVLALVALLLSLTAPSLRRFVHGREVREEARRLLAVARFASAEAVSRSDVVVLRLSPVDGTAEVYSLLRTDLPEPVGHSFVLPAAVGITAESDAFDEGDDIELVWTPDGGFNGEDLTALHVHGLQDDGDVVTLVPDEWYTRLVVDNGEDDE